MPIPDYENLVEPMLKVLCADGEDAPKSLLVSRISDELRLTPEEAQAMLPSGTCTVLEHRIDWARSYLQTQGLVEGSLNRGIRLTERGWHQTAERYPELARRRFTRPPEPGDTGSDAADQIGATMTLLGLGTVAGKPCERETLMQLKRLNEELGFELIERICRQPPSFFETLVIDLLVAMGYGNGHRALARKLGRSGDCGVDGVVALDELGLDLVYVQAKRYRPQICVPVSAVRDFVGSLDGKRASRGVFFTTSFYPTSAREYAGQSSFRIVLIDGRQLTELMMRHNIGVRVKDHIKVRRIDESYFIA
jgi:restriction system protein